MQTSIDVSHGNCYICERTQNVYYFYVIDTARGEIPKYPFNFSLNCRVNATSLVSLVALRGDCDSP